MILAPPPQASEARQTSACASRFSRSEKKTAGGFGGGAVSPPDGVRGGAPENFGFSSFKWPNFQSLGDLYHVKFTICIINFL